VRFQVLTAASMMFRADFWVVLHLTRQYNPEDSSEHQVVPVLYVKRLIIARCASRLKTKYNFLYKVSEPCSNTVLIPKLECTGLTNDLEPYVAIFPLST
jgi:hypothetical protein